MSNTKKETTPSVVYINVRTMQIVGEGYPNAVKYIREDVVKEAKEETHTCHMDDLSFIGHAV